MSLSIWLPLNGSLKNNGLDDYNFSNTNATVVDNGKIGKCYSFNGSAYLKSNTSLKSEKYFSISFWVKFNNVSATQCIICCRNATGAGLALFLLGGKFRFDTNSGADQWTTGYAVSANTWYHITLTKDSSYKKLYVNGALVESVASTSIINNLGTHTTIGASQVNGSGFGNYLNGFLNDIRVYDDYLSAKEIKEISKGLVLHYPMNRLDGVIGGRNLLLNSKGELTGKNNLLKINLSSHGINALKYGTQFTVSLDAKATVNGAIFDAYIRSSDAYDISNPNGKFTVTTEYKHYTFTASIINETKAGETLTLRTNSSSGNTQTGATFYFKNVKLELGSKESAYTLAPENDKVCSFDNVIYDGSGYLNNGTVAEATAPLWDNRSSVGQGSYKFSGVQYMIAPRTAMVKDALTVSIWAYMDDWSTYSARLVSCTEGGGWNFEPSGGKMQFAMGTGATSNTYKSIASTKTLASLAAGWHMFTGTYDGLSTKIYIDGVLEGTNSAYSTKTPIFYNTTNAIFVGAEASSSATAPASTYFSGLLSDFRIYATALSTNDISNLYRVKTFLARNGSLFCAELTEAEGDKGICRNGMLKTSSLNEAKSLYGMETKSLTDGSVWSRIFYHDCQGGTVLFSSETEALETNSTYKFSKLKYVEEFRCHEDSKFEFMLCYPTDAPTKYNRWKQSANPCTTADTSGDGSANAAGYEAIHIDWTANYWGGLLKSGSNTFLDGSTNHSNWFYAIGSYAKHGDGIPSYSSTANDVELWVRIDKVKNPQKFDKMSIYSGEIAVKQLIEC